MTKYAITITMSKKYFDEHFAMSRNRAIDAQGTEWHIISMSAKEVEIGQYPAFVVEGTNTLN